MQMHQAMQQLSQQQGGVSPNPSTDGMPGLSPLNPAAFLSAMHNTTAGEPASGAPPAPGGSTAGGPPNPMGSFSSGNVALGSMLQQAEEMMRSNPELMSQMMQAFMGGGAPGGLAAAGAPGASPNPFAAFGTLGSMGTMGAPFAGAAPDNRPPEERYGRKDLGLII